MTRRSIASGDDAVDADVLEPALEGGFLQCAVGKRVPDVLFTHPTRGTGHFQIELLTGLDAVPEAGALVMVSFPKPKDGSGFPARVIAIVPR